MLHFAAPWLLLLLVVPVGLACLPLLGRRWPRWRPATLQYSDVRLTSHGSSLRRVGAESGRPARA